jgi:phage protein U
MAGTLYQLGSFAFTLPEGAPELLTHSANYRWVQQDRLGRAPAQQWLGEDSQEIQLVGVLIPGFSGKQRTAETLRELAATGEPQMLTSGSGRIYGLYCLRGVREAKTIFMDNGDARRIAFDLDLVAYGPDSAADGAGPFGGMNLGGLAGYASELAGIAPFVGGASAFDAGAWGNSPLSAGTVDAALGSGLGSGQLGAISQTLTNASLTPAAAMGPVLGAFGIGGTTPALTAPQQGAWTALGLDPVALLQQVAGGQGGPAMAVGLDVLRGATTGQLSDLGGGSAAELLGLLTNSATMGLILDVDPAATDAVRSLLVLE